VNVRVELKSRYAPWLLGLFALYLISTLVSMAVMNVALLLLVAGMIAMIEKPKLVFGMYRDLLNHSAVRKYLLVSTLLALVCVLSLALSFLFPVEIQGRVFEVSIFSESRKLWYLFLPLILLPVFQLISAKGISKALYVWVGLFGILGVIAIIQYYTGWPRPQLVANTSVARHHASLFMGHHLSVASILVFPFFYSLQLLFSPGKFPLKGPRRLALLLIVLFGSIGLWLTLSRTLWLGLPIGIILWVGLSFNWRRALGVAVCVAITLASALGYGYFYSDLRGRLEDFGGWEQRERLWRANFGLFKERPVLGVGFRKNHRYSGPFLQNMEKNPQVFSGHAHNNLLEMLSGTGIIGLILWIAWWCVVLALLIQALKRGPPERDLDGLKTFLPALLAALLVFNLNGLTQVNFWDGKVLHTLMWQIAFLLFVVIRLNQPSKVKGGPSVSTS